MHEYYHHHSRIIWVYAYIILHNIFTFQQFNFILSVSSEKKNILLHSSFSTFWDCIINETNFQHGAVTGLQTSQCMCECIIRICNLSIIYTILLLNLHCLMEKWILRIISLHRENLVLCGKYLYVASMQIIMYHHVSSNFGSSLYSMCPKKKRYIFLLSNPIFLVILDRKEGNLPPTVFVFPANIPHSMFIEQKI